MYVYVYVYVCMYIYICVYLCVCVCIYVYMYICMYTCIVTSHANRTQQAVGEKRAPPLGGREDSPRESTRARMSAA